MVSERRLQFAEARVREVCRLLEGASGWRVEACLPLLEDARQLLAGAGPAAASQQVAVRTLGDALARARGLARESAMFYRECCWLGSMGARAYDGGGAALADQPRARILGEV